VTTDEPRPPEEKTTGDGAPDAGTEVPGSEVGVVETIDESIPMGGVPEPGPSEHEGAMLTETPHAPEGLHGALVAELSLHGAAHDPHGALHGTTGLSNNKMAMWLFLGSECLLFGGLISTYMLYRGRHSGSLGPDQIYDIPFTSVSSFVLLMSSLTMVLAVSAAVRDDMRNTKLWLTITALLGATFVGGQAYEFTTFYREGLGFTTSLFSSSFYTLTGFHGTHVTVGIIMLLSVVAMISRDRITGDRAEVVELVGLYWHFVDIVWIVIFTLVYLIPA
jgi:cytochrome c oxidase subunit 3/cytochrome o ubiquinol oxidase subunit 3